MNDPFNTGRCGGSHATATEPVWPSTSGTIAPTDTPTAASEFSSPDPVRRSFSGLGGGDAMFVWRRFIDASGQHGVNCAVFRNEGTARSSLLIRQADAIADHVWPGRRHYTYVRAEAVRSSNPGYCFLAAGWRKCGLTKGGLLILEREGVIG
jgi:hypothetical protein